MSKEKKEKKMSVITKDLKFNTKGHTDIIDITERVANCVNASKLSSGIVTIFIPGATGGITTIEYEPGLIKDLKEAFERLISEKIEYAHNLRHKDYNGHSHIRASFLGPSLTVPFIEGALQLGVWQKIVFIDFDNRPRKRSLIIQIIGE